MKKLVSKIRERKQPKEPVGRITNDTLAQHREKVLAGGRKFKYPVQYARHKLVINAAIIAVSAIILLIGVGWYLLYPAQNTSDFMYRVTRVVPVPVANVDGQPVRYSSYLMKYRSSMHYLLEKERIDLKTEDGKRQRDFIKTNSIDDAVADAYAYKLAQEQKISVDAAEIDAFIKRDRQSGNEEVSEATYASIILDHYNWTMSEYRDVLRDKLLRQKVAYKVDDKARGIGATIERLAAGEEAALSDIAADLNKDNSGTVSYTQPVWVPKDNQDSGIASAAGKLEKGQVSSAVTTPGDGYYYVKLLDKSDDQIQYEYLFVPLTVLDEQLEKVKKDDKVKYYITFERAEAATRKEQ